ncbi:hypothetical protein CEP51_000356 [Fusarium floridanum]|uniref:Uncharacterized protein n=1 Tax=Fusarium floridanum TaxID=1325733 RepID=A0A428SMV4_9HYPO|nr:hypothetical protein CEP51_000356 [Fusarium floridanum]
MVSYNGRTRMVIAAAAITTCIFILFTVFRVTFDADGLAIAPAPEHPFFYDNESQPTDARHGVEDETHDDKNEVEELNNPYRKRPGYENDYRLLTSLRNSMGFYNKIDVKKTGYQIMNPTLLEMPRGSNSAHDFLVIARTLHVDKVINGTKYRLARQVATFANLTYTKLGRPVLQSRNRWAKLIVQDFNGPDHHCQNQPDMDKYIGPEDMKLFWTRKGEPLLIFTYQVNSEVLCQGQFIVDVRAALPELERVLGEEYSKKMPPIQFKTPVGLRRQPPSGQESHPRYQREKNWAPAQSPFSNEDELLFMVEPGQLFRWTKDDEPVEEVVAEKDQVSAVEAPYPIGVEPEDTWHSDEKMTCMHDVMLSDKNVHQSSPMLSLTLCNRGDCEPDEQNTVMLGMVQRRRDTWEAGYLWYDRRIAAYSAAPPYNMVSVSRKLSYHGEVDGQYIWTGSMVYFTNQTDEFPRNHGFLDNEIWLSFGIKDSAAGWIDIKARDLITDHYLCQGASDGYKQYRLNLEE